MDKIITVYHGSTQIIETPVFGEGRKNNDYGLGFYCTENNELAKEWAVSSLSDGFSNRYTLDTEYLNILRLNSSAYTILNWVAVLVATLSGMVAGLVTGILHTKMGIPVILAGILTQLGLYSINLKILGGKSNQAISADKYNLIVSLRYVKNVAFYQNTIFIVAIFVIVIIAILYWFFGTARGCSIRATGCNPNMSRAQGINTNFNTVIGLMISNGLVGLASALYAQYQGFADVNAGRGAIVIGLAAVIIGTVLFEKIFRNFALKLLSVAIGAVIYYAVLQIVIWVGLDTNYLKLLSAAVVAIFLAVPYWKKKYFSKPVKKGVKTNA